MGDRTGRAASVVKRLGGMGGGGMGGGRLVGWRVWWALPDRFDAGGLNLTVCGDQWYAERECGSGDDTVGEIGDQGPRYADNRLGDCSIYRNRDKSRSRISEGSDDAFQLPIFDSALFR